MFSALLDGQYSSLSTFHFFLNCKEQQDLEIVDRSADVNSSNPLVYQMKVAFSLAPRD